MFDFRYTHSIPLDEARREAFESSQASRHAGRSWLLALAVVIAFGCASPAPPPPLPPPVYEPPPQAYRPPSAGSNPRAPTPSAEPSRDQREVESQAKTDGGVTLKQGQSQDQPDAATSQATPPGTGSSGAEQAPNE